MRYRATEVRWINGNPLVSLFVEVSTVGAETTFELTDLTPSTNYEIGDANSRCGLKKCLVPNNVCGDPQYLPDGSALRI